MNHFFQNGNQMSEKNGDDLLALIKGIMTSLKSCWQFLQNLRASTTQRITYAGLISDIVKNKPNDPYIKRCSVIRNQNTDGTTELMIVYLDDLNQPVWGPDPRNPFGWNMKTRELDFELEDAFGNNNMLILD